MRAGARKKVGRAASENAVQAVLIVLLSLVVAWADSTGALPTTGASTFLLQHHDASEVAPILDEVLRPTCCGRRADSIAHAAPATPSVPALRVEVDAARNALHFHGRPEAVREAVTLMRRLDVPATDMRAR